MHEANPQSIVEQTRFANIVVRLAVEHDGKYLMVQEGKRDCYGKWSFVGGKVDVGESLSEAALREVREEAGVEASLVGILGVQYVLWEDMPGFTLEIDLLASADELPEQHPLPKEILAVSWKPLEEIERLAIAGALRNPGQATICASLRAGDYLPASRLTEIAARPAPNLP